MPQVETAKTVAAKPPVSLDDHTVEVELLSDYWPTEAELKLNPVQVEMQPAAIPAPDDPGVAINTEPRFRAGSRANLSVNSAFRLVEQGKAKRMDW